MMETDIENNFEYNKPYTSNGKSQERLVTPEKSS